MINNFPPNTDPNLYAFIATIVGAIISEEFSPLELNSIGNWLILLGQYLETYVAQAQLIEGRQNNNNNQQTTSQIDYLSKAIDTLQNEINKIKKDL